jgi:Raf kinase inhibitor-like YbhB/YbcL family protein
MADLSLRSSAFTAGGKIPSRYTCEGDDMSPPLEWSGVPKGTKSLVLIVDDPDAPDPAAPKRVWVHWVLYNIPPDAKGLPEDADSKELPRGTKVGTNDWNKPQYGGPCPPIGEHRYFHKLYALDILIPGLEAPPKKDIERAMKGHVLAEAQLIGVYKCQGKC